MPDQHGRVPWDYLGAEALNVWAKEEARQRAASPEEQDRIHQAMLHAAEVCLSAAYLEPAWTIETLDKISQERKDRSGTDDDRPNRQAAFDTLIQLIRTTIVYRQQDIDQGDGPIDVSSQPGDEDDGDRAGV